MDLEHIYPGLHGKSVQFTKGGGDMTTCCQNFDELCSSMENSDNSGKGRTVFLSILKTNDKKCIFPLFQKNCDDHLTELHDPTHSLGNAALSNWLTNYFNNTQKIRHV